MLQTRGARRATRGCVATIAAAVTAVGLVAALLLNVVEVSRFVPETSEAVASRQPGSEVAGEAHQGLETPLDGEPGKVAAAAVETHHGDAVWSGAGQTRQWVREWLATGNPQPWPHGPFAIGDKWYASLCAAPPSTAVGDTLPTDGDPASPVAQHAARGSAPLLPSDWALRADGSPLLSFDQCPRDTARWIRPDGEAESSCFECSGGGLWRTLRARGWPRPLQHEGCAAQDTPELSKLSFSSDLSHAVSASPAALACPLQHVCAAKDIQGFRSPARPHRVLSGCLHDTSILVLGNSLDRNTTQTLCLASGGTYVGVPRTGDFREWFHVEYCDSPAVPGLTLVFVKLTGAHDGPYWKQEDLDSSALGRDLMRTSARLKLLELLPGYLGLETGAFDVVAVGAGLWDAFSYARAHFPPPPHPATRQPFDLTDPHLDDFVRHFEQEYSCLLQRIATMFPRASLVARSDHVLNRRGESTPMTNPYRDAIVDCRYSWRVFVAQAKVVASLPRWRFLDVISAFGGYPEQPRNGKAPYVDSLHLDWQGMCVFTDLFVHAMCAGVHVPVA